MSADDVISSIVVSYNCLESLRLCIDSLEKQKDVISEIVVVDNDSSDGSVEYLRDRDLVLIEPGRNLGYGAAVNLGAKRAKGKYLFILNPDTEFGETTLSELLSYARGSENIGLISPILRYPDGREQLSARRLPGRKDFFLGRGSPLFKLGITGEKQAGYVTVSDHGPVDVPAVSATALFMESTFYDEIGGFDERFFLYLEDIDLCRRVREKGRKIILLPSVTVTHLWRRSSSKRRFFTSWHHHLSVWKYFRKYEPNRWLANIVLLFAISAGFVFSSMLNLIKMRNDG